MLFLFQSYLIPIVFILGMVGNSVSLVCLYNSELHRLSFLHYLLAVIVADCINIVQLFVNWVSTLG